VSLKDECNNGTCVCGNHSQRQELPNFSVEVFPGFILIIIFIIRYSDFFAVLGNLTSFGMRYIEFPLSSCRHSTPAQHHPGCMGERKLRGTGNIKESSHSAIVKFFKSEILYLTV